MTDTATTPAPAAPAVRIGDHIHVFDAESGADVPAHVLDHGAPGDPFVQFTRLGTYGLEKARYDPSLIRTAHGVHKNDVTGRPVAQFSWHLPQDCSR